MLRSLFLSLMLILFIMSKAQFADVRGVVHDPTLKYNLQGAQVNLFKDETLLKTVITGNAGIFQFANLQAGTYTLEVRFYGYSSYKTIFNLRSDQSKYMNIAMYMEDKMLSAIDVPATIDLDITGGGDLPMDGEKVKEGPYSNAIGQISTDPALTTRGNDIRFSDGRAEQTKILENGIISLGPANPTSLGLGQVRAISKGVPVMYGDFTGGLIEITASRFIDTFFHMSTQITSSQLLDPYNRNAFETLWYSPLKTKKSKTILGISHSFYFSHNKDGNPTATQNYKYSEEAKRDVYINPFVNSPNGDPLSAYFFANSNDFVKVNTRENVGSMSLYNHFTVQFIPNNKLSLAMQPSYYYTRGNRYSFANSLFNSEHNPLNTTGTAKLNIQLSHQLKQPYNSEGILTYDSTQRFSSINYLLIADFQQFSSKTVDPLYGENIFEYGHIGSFSKRGEALYQYIEDPAEITDQYGNKRMIQGYHSLIGYQDTAVLFHANTINDRNVFTQYVFDHNTIRNYDEIQQLQASLNGQQLSSIYSMWYAPGTVVSSYAKSQTEKLSLLGILNASWHPSYNLGKKHDIQLGVLFEQTSSSYYSLNATSLWTLMPQLLNRQYVKLDTDNPILSYDQNGVFLDTVKYNWITDPTQQTGFDKSLRAMVDPNNGYRLSDGHFIDVQSVDPSLLSLNMFSADELWNNGNSYVNYAGYDYLGNRIRKQKAVNDFILDTENRAISSFSPIYTALWLQDKFVLDKINFRAGLRIERYDANQAVLKDEYSLYPTYTTAELTELNGTAVVHPSTIGKDFVVYVDDMYNPTKIAGYRDGKKWYDAKGNELQSAEPIRSASSKGVIQPYLIDPQNQQLTSESFKDYEPQILILPRLSFSFPINKEALFFAYYDKFAQRPNAAQSFTPVNNYYFIQNNANGVLPNPKLKPSQRTDYQIGFRQQIGRASLISLTAGYAEVKNDINLVYLDQAYPVSYTSYANIDFSTIKSFKAEYYVKRNTFYLRTSYMLQFADGTGSNVNSAQALIASNQPNLRSLFPLDYDVRHKFNVNLSVDLYELGDVLCSAIFKDMSINIYYNTQSGSPYTAYINAVPQAQDLGNASRSQVKGNPLGSRLPWNSNLDLSVLKKIKIQDNWFEIQFNALNVLNNLNIFKVYSFSSLPNDDGYLTSPVGIQQINNQVDAQTFTYLYNLKQNNPAHFGAPRTMSITLRANF